MESFKRHVVEAAIDNAEAYRDVFVNYEYLICSRSFGKGYYIVSAREDNYKHLIGVSSALSAREFFEACIRRTLTEADISFAKKNRSEKEVKGSVRKKIKVLPALMRIFEKDLVAQENFVKNRVSCAFATTDCLLTIGFVDTGRCRPMTLLSGDELNWAHAAEVDAVFRKPYNAEKFDAQIYGDAGAAESYRAEIGGMLDEARLGSGRMRNAGKENR